MPEYNTAYWAKRIPQYLAANWSHGPTPFARLAADYFPAKTRLLELGAGAGQDGLWFASEGFDVIISDGQDIEFSEIQKRAQVLSLNNVRTQAVDISKAFPFEDNTFGAIYAQLVLNYFDDKTMRFIIEEIERVLKPGGILACVVNSTKDREYEPAKAGADGLIIVKGLMKRYFTLDTFTPFVEDFEAIVFNEEGRTPKDDSVGTVGLIQFIGRKR